MCLKIYYKYFFDFLSLLKCKAFIYLLNMFLVFVQNTKINTIFVDGKATY
jgi:hypothetical protein